jgi:hypothetical protein
VRKPGAGQGLHQTQDGSMHLRGSDAVPRPETPISVTETQQFTQHRLADPVGWAVRRVKLLTARTEPSASRTCLGW